MAFPTKDTFTFDFETQTDYPNWTPAQTKEHMNERGEELRIVLNAVANLLNATTSDASGADNIGIPETIAGSGTNVRDRADWLYTQIVAAVLGAIPDGSLTTIKYADGSVTAAKCASDVATQAELDGLAGVGRTTETVKGNADSLASHQAEDATDAHTPKNVGIPIQAAGDLIIGTDVNTAGRVAIGGAGESLKVNATGDGYEFGAGGAWEKILVDNGTTIVDGMLTLASDTTQVDFESLGLDDYRLIHAIVRAKSTNASSEIKLRTIFNDDVISGNYFYIQSITTATSISYGNGAGIPVNYNMLPRNDRGFALYDFEISNKLGMSKAIKVFAGTQFLNAAFPDILVNASCTWNNAALLNKLSFTVDGSVGDKFATGSTFTLLGVK